MSLLHSEKKIKKRVLQFLEEQLLAKPKLSKKRRIRKKKLKDLHMDLKDRERIKRTVVLCQDLQWEHRKLCLKKLKIYLLRRLSQKKIKLDLMRDLGDQQGLKGLLQEIQDQALVEHLREVLSQGEEHSLKLSNNNSRTHKIRELINQQIRKEMIAVGVSQLVEERNDQSVNSNN